MLEALWGELPPGRWVTVAAYTLNALREKEPRRPRLRPV